MNRPISSLISSKFLTRPSTATAAPGDLLTIDSRAAWPLDHTPEGWQVRRAHFARIIQQIQSGDDRSQEDLDRILIEFDNKPLGRTPIENLEILGAHYISMDGLEKSLPAIVINQVLGWYDALRFGTASGRDEIVLNEGFFKRAFVIAGANTVKHISTWIRDQPDQVAAVVDEGLSSCDPLKNKHEYDVLWPTAYGLERTIRALGGKSPTTAHLPEDQWSGAWHSSKRRVRAYYIPSALESS
jgi:hypothetical protein